MQKINRNQCQPYTEFNMSKHLLKHQSQMIQFLCFTAYDIVLESFQLKHASYISSTKRGYPVQEFKKGEQIERHFEMMSEKLHIRVIRDDLSLDKSLDRLQMLWHTKSIPHFHRYYFEKIAYSTFVKNLEPLIQTQEKLIKQDRHILYKAQGTIKARQACLRQIKRQLAELSIQDVYEYLHIARQRFHSQKKKTEQEKLKLKGYKLKSVNQQQPTQQAKLSKCKLQFFSDSFGHLIKLTLYCIEEILKWKDYIYNLTHDAKRKRDRLEYYYFEENYLLKILSDTGFIKVSCLEKFYKFAPKNDPFLLWPILAFEKAQVKQLDHELLKKIFLPLGEQLPQILNKIEVLSEEYKWNIRSRKNYDISVLRKPHQISQEKKKLNGEEKIEKQPISNLVLRKIQASPKRSSSLKTFRIREETKEKNVVLSSSSKDKILIQFKTSPKKRAQWLPGGTLRTVIETQTSPIKNSIIVQKNKANPLASNTVSDQLLKSLKQQVIRKIKQDFQASQPSQPSQDSALQLYINTKINEAIKGIFPYQPEKQLKPPIELTYFRIDQHKLSQEMNLMIKHTPQIYSQMQFSAVELMKRIQLAPYVYFIKASVGNQYLATIVVALDQDVHEYKVLKTLFVGFNDASQLEMLLVQTTKFLEKYDNAFQVHFPFLQPTTNQPIKQLLTLLQNNLTNPKQSQSLPCMVAQKQSYSNIAQIRYIFKRQNKNTNFYPNRFPTSLHFKLAMLHSEKKLFLQRSKIDKNYSKKVDYDFLLSEILRKVYDSTSMNILKEKSLSQTRFKNIVNTMVQLDKGQQKIFGQRNMTKFTQCQSISELNKQLSKKKELYPYLELSDTVKMGNKVQFVSFSGVFSLGYPLVKSICGKNNQMFYKVTVREQVQVIRCNETLFFKLPLIDQGNGTSEGKFVEKHLILFSAAQFIKLNNLEIATYLTQCLITSPSSVTFKTVMNELWLPMLRFPSKYQERQELYMTTHRLQELKQLKEELFVGEFFQWFCDMQISNGIVYQSFDETQKQAVFALTKPLGLAIVVGEGKDLMILYGRVFDQE